MPRHLCCESNNLLYYHSITLCGGVNKKNGKFADIFRTRFHICTLASRCYRFVTALSFLDDFPRGGLGPKSVRRLITPQKPVRAAPARSRRPWLGDKRDHHKAAGLLSPRRKKADGHQLPTFAKYVGLTQSCSARGLHRESELCQPVKIFLEFLHFPLAQGFFLA
jgi:hypothetical protein